MASSTLKVFGETSTYLPPLPALRDFIKMYRLKAEKALSQNYLMDMNLCRKVNKYIFFIKIVRWYVVLVI